MKSRLGLFFCIIGICLIMLGALGWLEYAIEWIKFFLSLWHTMLCGLDYVIEWILNTAYAKNTVLTIIIIASILTLYYTKFFKNIIYLYNKIKKYRKNIYLKTIKNDKNKSGGNI